MTEHDVAVACVALPVRFANRVPPSGLDEVQLLASVGEWLLEVEELVACLLSSNAAITEAERRDLLALAKAMDMPTDEIARLRTA